MNLWIIALTSFPEPELPPPEDITDYSMFVDYLKSVTAPAFEFLQNRIQFLDIDFSLWEFMIGSAIVSLVLYGVYRILD